MCLQEIHAHTYRKRAELSKRVIPYDLEGRLNEFGIKCIPHAVGFIL